MKALAILACLTASAGFLRAVWHAPGIIENDHRLAPTFAVAHGYRLYYGPEQGPVLSTIYGPVTALAYVPALLAHTPMTAVRIATMLSLALFFFPMILVARKGARTTWPTFVYLLGLAAALTFLSVSLENSSVLVHADAPALAAAGLACWLSRWKGLAAAPRHAFWAGVFAAVAVMTKQNMVPLLVALTLFWLLISFRSMLLFTGAVTISLLAMWGGLQIVSSSPEAAWFNWFQIPTRQQYDKALFFPSLESLVRTSMLYLFPLVGVFRKIAQPASARWRVCLRHPTILLVWVGCWLIPTSLLGRMKAGGSENALSPAIYFFALACMVELSARLTESSGKLRRRNAPAAVLTFLFTAFIAVKLPEEVYFFSKGLTRSSMESVYLFCRTNPGEIYFPQFPLTVLMAEGSLYDFSWGLSDRRSAGYPVSEVHFREHTPPSAYKMALVPWVRQWETDIYSRCKEGHALTSEPTLPGFTICTFR